MPSVLQATVLSMGDNFELEMAAKVEKVRLYIIIHVFLLIAALDEICCLCIIIYVD